MEGIFLNFTNHPSDEWEQEQAEAAAVYGSVRDLPFPAVDPCGDRDYIVDLARQCVERIMEYQPTAVLCQGEFCLAYHVIRLLKEREILVLAACAERITETDGNRKTSTFVFRQFREY
ncbi:MAG: hypothetical protein LUE92_02630 [Clostridiales bacterium]|nr:hypothetical protein [Clostridiales bacterium]